MYEVIRYFRDAQDNEYAYHEGDIYPREGHTVSDVRLKDLLSGNNFQQVPLIKRVDAVGKVKKAAKKAESETVEESFTREDIMKMPFMKLKSVAKKNGVEVEDRKAEDIRLELIEKLEL